MDAFVKESIHVKASIHAKFVCSIIYLGDVEQVSRTKLWETLGSITASIIQFLLLISSDFRMQH